MTTFTRLTVVGSARKAELVVPDDESIGGLIPRLMELLEEPLGPVARPLTLVRATGEQLDAALSAAEQGLADGEQLRLVRADDAPPPPEVADVTDVVGDSYADRRGRWTGTAREALGSVVVGAAACVALLVDPPSATADLVLLVVAVAGAVLLGRLGHRWPCLALTAAAAGAALPVGWALLGGATGPADWPARSAVAWVLVWGVLGFGVGAGLRRRAAAAGAALGAVLGALPLVLVALGTEREPAVALTAVAASVVCGLLPWYALSSSGLSGLDDQVLAGRPSRRSSALRTVGDAYHSLSWSAVAVAGVLGVTSALLLAGRDRWTLALGLAVTVLTALRTRVFPLVLQQVPLALAAASATAVGLLSRRGLGPSQVAGALAVLAVVVVVAVGVRPAAHQRARLRRWGDVAEGVAVVSLLPLLLGVFGVYHDLVEAFR
ncbi:EsaB/YukD family protein [uncultured Friedmanniella sp.]|uniref:EsaB/YukD family protein n=1 Tax=uncultured Friedmanniella sp. TaxID=335381 RepID=UPI0035C9DAD5